MLDLYLNGSIYQILSNKPEQIYATIVGVTLSFNPKDPKVIEFLIYSLAAPNNRKVFACEELGCRKCPMYNSNYVVFRCMANIVNKIRRIMEALYEK